MEDDAVAAFGVGPGNGSRLVADEIARAALKAVFVVEQDAAVAGGDKRFAGHATTHSRVVHPRHESPLTVICARS